MGHKLSILSRQYDKTGWHKSKQFNTPEIQTIKVDGAGKGKSLNAIPSPFARMHLFQTAFEMVYHDLINKTKLAGEAYNRLVSDCMDIFELIFNWDSHINDGKQLELVSWNRDAEIRDLKESTNSKHKLLGRTFDTFLLSEKAFEGFDQCIIIKYKGKSIAGSSPFTGFFTSPDDLTSLGLLKPLSQIAYFSRTIPFNDRKPEIKKFIYDFFEKNNNLRNSEATSALRYFLEWQHNQGHIAHSTILELKPLTVSGIRLKIFGKELETAKSIGTQFFEKNIVRLNHRLNDTFFIFPFLNNNEREYDYLLPLTPSFFEEFDQSIVPQIVVYNEIAKDAIEVKINSNGRWISKIYRDRPLNEQDGKIIDLEENHQIRINFGFFPFLKMIDQPDGLEYNDFYRVMMTIEDLRYQYSNKDFKLSFGKDRHIFEPESVYKVSRVDRSIFEKDKCAIGSTFYGLNTCFDFMRIEFPKLVNDEPLHATIIPKWKEKKIGQKQIDFAIDFGTTSTFVAFTDDSHRQTEPKPFEFSETEMPVVLLNKPKERRADFSLIDLYERTVNSLLLSIEIQKQEFLPSLIQKNGKYHFPIRTVLYQQASLDPNLKFTLQNANISFVYQTKDSVNIGLNDQEFITNLKWNIKTNASFESAISTFIEELFILIRTKILLNDGNPKLSKICWFSPLSFTSATERSYTTLWNNYSRIIFKSSDNNVYNLTESEAPFYYLFKNATINNTSSVLTLDIGGGSTDIMLFNENRPAIGTSVHFGANIIWGNGFSNFLSEKSNGIYLALKDVITENLKHTELKTLNEGYCSTENSKVGSDEIISFWLGNDNLTKVTSKLNSGDFRLTYLLHLSALVYHSLKMIASNKQKPPTCIIFSGNGSKYIDLIHDSKFIEKIWGYFSRKIFGYTGTDPQVILPIKNRKEATCYGGLFESRNSRQFKVDNYLGFEKSEERYKKYIDIEKNKVSVFESTLSAFSEFLEWFFAMNDEPGMNFRNVLGIEDKLSAIKKFLTDKAVENMNLGYEKRLKLVAKDDLVTDSLFFYPLVGLIYKLNKLTPNDIDDLLEKKTYYFNGPDEDGHFPISKASSEMRPDSIYALTIELEYPDIGHITILDDPTIQKRAIAAYQGYLSPVCTSDSYPEAGKLINVITPGQVRKLNDKWILAEKIKIEFV